jgi:Spy/CpxP family protein refolding chaperone
MNPRLRWLLFSFCVVSAGVGSFYGSRAAMAAQARGSRQPDLAQALQLTPQQTSALRNMQSDLASHCQGPDAEVACCCTELCRLVKEPSPDRREIESYVSRTTAAQAEIQREAIGQLIGVRGILDQRQRTQFDQMLCNALHPESAGIGCSPCSGEADSGAGCAPTRETGAGTMHGGMTPPKQ